METPSQFAPPPPVKKNNTLLIVILVILGISVLCCGGVFFAGYGFFNKMKGTLACTMRFMGAREALKKYAAAHKGKLPSAAHWQDDIIPYYATGTAAKDMGGSVFDLGDPRGSLGCPADSSGPATGMAFNSTLAGKLKSDVLKEPSTILLFEVKDPARNLSMPYKVQPGYAPQKMLGANRPWWTLPVEGSLNNQPTPIKDPNFGGL